MKRANKAYQKGIAPNREKLFRAPNYYISDPESRYDNAESLRKYLELVQAPSEIKKELLIPWENGYYMLSDGKSHPVHWLRVPSRLRVLGLQLDPPAVLHDYRYYQGANRKTADREYYHHQLALGMRRVFALVEYHAIRAGGWMAWIKHAERRSSMSTIFGNTTVHYGSDEYILAMISG